MGTKTYKTETDPGESEIEIDGHAVGQTGDGFYSSMYTLKPGENPVVVKAKPKINLRTLGLSCPGTCTDETKSTEMLPMERIYTVYGVSVNTAQVPVIWVDDSYHSVMDYGLTYTIEPIGSPYRAMNAYVVIYKNGEMISIIPTETQGQGIAWIGRGFTFEPYSEYQMQVILNYGTGFEIKGTKVQLPINELRVELIDDKGNARTEAQIGDDKNFVSWEKIEIKYRISPQPADESYAWTVTPGTSQKVGHVGLGAPAPTSIALNKSTQSISFVPASTGSTTDIPYSQKKLKAKPLIFQLNCFFENKLVKTFSIEQSYKNALREEYKAAGADVMVQVDDYDNEALQTDIKVTSPYDKKDLPKISKLNKLRNNLLMQKYSITSSYRNPYKNFEVSDTGTRSRHVWSGAVDAVDSANKGRTDELKLVWNDTRIKPAVFGTVLVESDKKMIVEDALANYISKNLLPTGSTIAAVVFETISSHNSYSEGSYVIVWSTAAQWGNISFWWVDQSAEGVYTTHLAQQYQLKDSDWQFVAKNLHLQDRQNGSVQEGF